MRTNTDWSFHWIEHRFNFLKTSSTKTAMLILLSLFACIEEDRGNQAPVLTYISGPKSSIWENFYYGIDKTIAKWINVKDSLGSTLMAAEIKIVDGFVPSEDKLNFLSQNGITGTFDTATATLKLNGESSIANYEIALQSVSYENKNGFSNNDRNISFQVDDGRKRSNIIYRKVKFISYSQNQIQLALASWKLDYYRSGSYSRDPNGGYIYTMQIEVSHENTPAESEFWKKTYDFRPIENDQGGSFIFEISTGSTLCSQVYGTLWQPHVGEFILNAGEPVLLNACDPIIQIGNFSGFSFNIALEPKSLKLQGTQGAGGPTIERILILKR